MKINNIQTQKLLIYFLFVHIFLWTIIPSIINNNLHLDTIEVLAWGNELQLGYDKYPPVFPLFTELFFKVFGNQDWAYYLLSQLFVASSFIIIFQFAKHFFENKIHCLFSVLLLETIYFFNYTTPELNAFLCQFPFLSLSALYCWRAINKNKNFDWFMFGFFAGIATLTYYLSLYLLASISIFFIFEIIKNKKFNNKYFLTLIVYLITLSPHLYWIFNDNFTSIEYALFRSFGDPLSEINNFKYSANITYPFIFLMKQLLILVPFFLMLSTILNRLKITINFKDKKLIFLLVINIFPIALVFLTSLFLGVKIRTMWMTPFYLFLGVLLIYIFQEKIILKKIKYFFSIFLILFIFSPGVYLYISLSQDNKRTDYPGNKISKKVQKIWDNNFSNKINIVGGNEWYAGNLSYHLKSRPKWDNIFDNNKDNVNKNLEDGFVLIGNFDILNKICKGVFLKIENQGVCMIGIKK